MDVGLPQGLNSRQKQGIRHSCLGASSNKVRTPRATPSATDPPGPRLQLHCLVGCTLPLLPPLRLFPELQSNHSFPVLIFLIPLKPLLLNIATHANMLSSLLNGTCFIDRKSDSTFHTLHYIGIQHVFVK